MDPSTRGTDTLEMMPRMLKRAVVLLCKHLEHVSPEERERKKEE